MSNTKITKELVKEFQSIMEKRLSYDREESKKAEIDLDEFYKRTNTDISDYWAVHGRK